MENNEKTSKLNYDALALFFELSGWIAIPIILALFIGRWLDGKWNSEPTFILISIGSAFIITVAGIIRKGKKLMKEINKDKDNETRK